MTLSSMSTGEKINSFSLSDDRADIIEYAALIFIEILNENSLYLLKIIN